MVSSTQLVLLHYGEVGLKGRNRKHFEERLRRNAARMLADLPGPIRVRRLFGRMEAELPAEVPWEAIRERLQRVFGLVYFCPVFRCASDYDTLSQEVLARLEGREIGTFAVRARRVDRAFPMTSPEINTRLGSDINVATGAKVQLKGQDTTVVVQVLHDGIYYYFERCEGPGGLPVGVGGRVLCLLSGGIDSPVAAWSMMRRGVGVDFLHFHSAPFTDEMSQEKARELAEVLTRYQFEARLFMCPFGNTQKAIVTGAPAEERVLLYRRFMMRIAERVARKHKLKALVTGESLGQVASQTLTNLGSIQAAIDWPVLRPLIAFDKREIITRAQAIGTYEMSIEPHQDCCSFLMPRKPATRSTPGTLAHAERELDIDALVEEPLTRISEETLRSGEATAHSPHDVGLTSAHA